jgi:hypothetical protein
VRSIAPRPERWDLGMCHWGHTRTAGRRTVVVVVEEMAVAAPLVDGSVSGYLAVQRLAAAAAGAELPALAVEAGAEVEAEVIELGSVADIGAV